jgi:hypothetical protein
VECPCSPLKVSQSTTFGTLNLRGLARLYLKGSDCQERSTPAAHGKLCRSRASFWRIFYKRKLLRCRDSVLRGFEKAIFAIVTKIHLVSYLPIRCGCHVHFLNYDCTDNSPVQFVHSLLTQR